MNTRLVVVAPALVLVTALGGPALAQGDPSPSVGAFVCADGTSDCAGLLDVGGHATVHFDHPFSFESGEGWVNVLDRDRAYILSSELAPNATVIIWSQAAPSAQTEGCEPARLDGLGVMTADWLGFLEGHPGLVLSDPVVVDLGGLPMTTLEVTVDPAWTAMCPFNTSPFVMIVSDTGQPPTRNHGQSHGDKGLMGFVDVGDQAIVVNVDGTDDASWAAVLEQVQPVVETIRFDAAEAGPMPSPAS